MPHKIVSKQELSENVFSAEIEARFIAEIRKPGQFVMLELPGIDEAPFSISSSPSIHGEFELCIRSIGNLTNFLPRLKAGTHSSYPQI